MERHPVYGVSVPEKGWVPALRYALRRDRVLDIVSKLPRPRPGDTDPRALEVGCGSGSLLSDLAALGYSCEAVESSPAALELATYVNRGLPQVRIHPEPQPGWEQNFDLLMAFEVLEHIEDDAGALAQWRSWIRPGGRILLSVPARMSRWSASDLWVGHYRRYERAGLLDLLERVGFGIEHHECYGFPLSNATERVRSWVDGRRMRRAGSAAGTLESRTARSGVERSLDSRIYPFQASWPGIQAFRALCWLQERVLDRELGTGYLVLAVRRSRQ